jgi:hypothetical protein
MGACDTGVVATSPHNNDILSDISDLLLLAPTAATIRLTTRLVATHSHSSDGPSDIRGPLLLAPTVVTDLLTSEGRCYCGACGTGVVATSPHSNDEPPYISSHCYSPHSSDEPSDIRGLLLLWGHVAQAQLLLAPVVAMGILTSVAHCY